MISSQLYFKNVNNSGGKYQEFSKAIGVRANGDERMYSVQGHSIEEDDDNFYVTISKMNNDLLTKQNLILNRTGLQRILEGSNVLVLNEEQIKTLPANVRANNVEEIIVKKADKEAKKAGKEEKKADKEVKKTTPKKTLTATKKKSVVRTTSATGNKKGKKIIKKDNSAESS